MSVDTKPLRELVAFIDSSPPERRRSAMAKLCNAATALLDEIEALRDHSHGLESRLMDSRDPQPGYCGGACAKCLESENYND